MNSGSVSAPKHPKGLYFLFFTEMWERFGYYLMLGIFVLYMTDVDKGGLGIADANADDIFGTFIAFTYLTPFLGGFLADRLLGYVKAIYIGGTLMGLGYLGLALPGMASFYTSISLVIIGNGFFKPSVSTLLGNLYNNDEYKKMKDSGYNIFYMGINLGAFICNIIAAFMRNKYGWEAAFISAGVGMFLGLAIFTIGLPHVKHANVLKPADSKDMSISGILLKVFLPAMIVGGLGWLIPGTIFGSDTTDAFIFAVIPIIIFYTSLYVKANASDKRPIAALLAIFAVSIMFWAVFKQNGTALTRWAKFYTDREVPTAVEGTISSLYLAEEINSEVSEVTKYDDQFRVVKENGEVVKEEGRHFYYQNMPADEIPSPDTTTYLFNTELFQSINPFWVVTLSLLVVAFFSFLAKRNREPSTPTKIAWGLFISAMSTLVMVGAVYAGSNGAIKVSPMWLVASYGVITLGELFLSPMGLSLVSKLSPPRLTALMMGGFFLSTAIGNKLSGVLATMWYNYDNKANFFIVNCVLLLVAAGIAFSLLKWLNQVMKEKNL